MSGAGWAALSGVGFGLFQALNARAVRGLESAYVSTFLQLLVAAVVLGVAAVATEDVGALADAPAIALLAFALAGLIHFFVGWTTLNLSQARIGAARTSPLLATSPLFGLVLAAIFAGQTPGAAAVVGVAVTIVGAVIVAGGRTARLADSGFALATALAWAVSPLLVVEGLEDLDSPLLSVTLGMVAAALAYGLVLAGSRSRLRLGEAARGAISWKLAAGLVVALATWSRWVAIDGASIAVVLALNLVAVPVVLMLAPLLSRGGLESVAPRVWGGAAILVAGALLLILVD